MRTVVHLGGRFTTPAEARVSALDRGYLLGDGVFATLRGYGGVCFRAEVHLEALARSAALFGISMPLSTSELATLVDEAARRTEAPNAHVRATLTRGAADEAPTFSIVARPMDVPSAELYRNGIDVVTASARRIPPACFDPAIKTTSYAPAVLARREAEARGASDAIMLAVDGALASGTMSNLFVVRGDALLTPSLESGCRPGVTRAAVLELAPSLFREVREEPIDPACLAGADEAFLTSTRIECLPIASIDGRQIGGLGPNAFARTKAVLAAFRALVARETARVTLRAASSDP